MTFPILTPGMVLEGIFAELLKKVGSGAQAEVWHVRDCKTSTDEYAVRISAIPSQLRGQARYNSWIARLEKETDIWRSFDNSIFVVNLRDRILLQDFECESGEVFDLYLQSMQYIPNGSLDQIIYRDDRSNFLNSVGRRGQFIGFLSNIASALFEGHQKGFTHGDLKPSNIMLHKEAGGNGFPKLMDFGISSSFIDANFELSGFIGTPEYASLEFLKGVSERDVPTDIYALGVVFIELLRGQKYIQGTDELSDKSERIQNVEAQLRLKTPVREQSFRDDIQLDDHQKTRLANLIKKMTIRDRTRPDIGLEEVIAELNSIASPSGARDSTISDVEFIYKNTYRWPQWLHALAGEKPHYFLMKSPSSIDDEDWLIEEFGKRGIEGYSLYRVLGTFDFLLRMWVTDEALPLVQQVMQLYLRTKGRRAKIEHIEVNNYSVASDPERPKRKHDDLEAALREIATSAQSDRKEEFAILKKKGLATSLLSDDRKGKVAIRVFLFVVTYNTGINQLTWNAVTDQLRRVLQTYASGKSKFIRSISTYQCDVNQLGNGGKLQSGVMFRFILNDFHRYSDIVEAISIQREVLEGSINDDLRITSFFELDKRGRLESDDGRLLRQALAYRDADPK